MARIRKTEALPPEKSVPKRVFDGPAFLAMIEEATKDVPREAWDELPPDLAENFEEYEYGGKPWPR